MNSQVMGTQYNCQGRDTGGVNGSRDQISHFGDDVNHYDHGRVSE